MALTGRVAAVTRALVLVAATALTFAGCSRTHRAASPPATVRPGDLVAVEGPSPAGRFVAKIGADDLNSDLYDVVLPSQFRRLTNGARVSTVGGCPGKIVVAAAQREVGYLDTLQEFKGGRLVPLDKPGPEHAFGPDLTPDCRLLFEQTHGEASNITNEVKTYDPETGTTTVVASGPTVSGGSWGPDGQVLVLRREPSGPRLDVVRPGGASQELDPQVADVGDTQWGKAGWIAMAVFAAKEQPPTATLFMDPTSGQRSTLDGWLPLAWSPAGDQLLVRDAAKGTTLAVVETTDLGKTRNVGVSTVGTVWDAVWLPA